MKTKDDVKYDAIPLLDASQKRTGNVLKACMNALEAHYPSAHPKTQSQKSDHKGTETADTDNESSRRYCQDFLKTFNSDILATNKHSRMLNAIKRREMHGSADVTSKKQVETQLTGQAVPQPQYNGGKLYASQLTFTFNTQSVLESGMLQKQGSWRQNWKRRYFMLRSDFPSLCYYKSKEKLDLLGYTRITRDTLILDRSSKTQEGTFEFRFQVRGDNRSISLKADSTENLTRWTSSVQKLVDSVREAHFRPTPQPAQVNTTAMDQQSDARILLTEYYSDGQNLMMQLGSQHIEDTQLTEDQQIVSSFDQDDAWSEETSSNLSGNKPPKKELYRGLERKGTALSREINMYRHKKRALLGEKDICVEILFGSRCRFLSTDIRNDKTACFVRLIGVLQASSACEEIATTDAVQLVAAESTMIKNIPGLTFAQKSSSESVVRLSFSLVISCELQLYREIKAIVYRCLINQNVELSQQCVGAGTAIVKNSCVLTIPIQDSSACHEAPELGRHKRGDLQNTALSCVNVKTEPFQADSMHVYLHSFPAHLLQNILPTSDRTAAYMKYRFLARANFTTNLKSTVGEVKTPMAKLRRCFHSLESSRSLEGINLHLGKRMCAVEEILRTPHSTFGLPIAFLDYLETKVLENTRSIRELLMDTRNQTGHAQSLLKYELCYHEMKEKEYVKQRQFLLKQEKQMKDEEGCLITKTLKIGTSSTASKNKAESPTIFKRSVFRNIQEWQFVPTNMQNQYMCLYQTPDIRMTGEDEASQQQDSDVCLVWHTMTMGCPAAHTKGFSINGNWSEVIDQAAPKRIVRTFLAIDSTSKDDAETYDYSAYDRSSLNLAPGGTGQTANRTKLTAEESMTELKHRLTIRERLHIVSCQILSAAVANILASLDLAVLGSQYHQMQLNNACGFGYFLSFESLLSTKGKETGMLEDFSAAVKWLRNVHVRFRKHYSSGNTFTVRDHTSFKDSRSAIEALGVLPIAYTNEQIGKKSSIMVTIGISMEQMKVLPLDLTQGSSFRIRAVLFTQGINENQSLANAIKSSAVKLQDKINRENLLELRYIYLRYCRLHGHSSTKPLQTLDGLLNRIEKHVATSSNHYKKTFDLLIDTSDFCRELGAARVTSCKSGKDRTAMSVTMEQTRICEKELNAVNSKMLCHNMRLYGVRRKNVFMNIGAWSYAFNEVQRKLLPDCYKPPTGSYKSGKT
uniref:Type II inositol3 putative n=1 Tax=Albugo laibachii Nc14 TaxID=890382 RepID=F0W910_9STRA|nr:type II inositol3 putative [Albugo laibachii Nc14]|eukprot:CCA17621.1 type II inositol3 putative [Albugo laibachii Nc14]